ncbi:MAG: InlB B-repeat-containing protein, partial [Candidatus Thermoplasmatota archaeon]|nr:InlB B-repeat-containing protein [Candidatus Thermoplasmatota archaeon]
VNLTAVPDQGYEFDGWTGDYTGSEDNITITMDSDKEITAQFEIKTYELTVNTVGEGSVDVEPEKMEYEHGEEVNLTAVPDQGYEFDGWTGDYTGSEDNITITMDSDKEITAQFEIKTYELTVNTVGEGSVDVEPEKMEYEQGEVVNLTSVPDEGHEFIEWTGDYEGAEKQIEITMDTDKEITAQFEIKTYELTIYVEGEGETNPLKGSHTYKHGEEVTIVATPDMGWYFDGWSGDHLSTEDSIIITMEEDKTIIATFEEYYTLEIIEINGQGTVTIDGEFIEKSDIPHEKYYEQDGVADLFGEAAEGWYFVEWTGVPADQEEDQDIELTMKEDRQVTAIFEKDEYNLTIDVVGEGSIDPEEGTYTYEGDTEVTIIANAEEGWYLKEWTGNHEGSKEEITITMDQDKEITARFELIEYTLTINIEGEGDAEPSEGTHIYEYGEEVAVRVTPEDGWYFKGWTGDHNGTEETITVMMDDNKSITGHLDIYEYDLTINIEGEGKVDINPSEEKYEKGTEVTLIAVQAEGWCFKEWKGDVPEGEHEKEKITIKMDQSKVVGAHFEKDEVDKYTLKINLIGEGEIKVDGEKITLPYTAEYENGSDVSLEAIAMENWSFKRWTGEYESNERRITITIEDDTEMIAHLEKIEPAQFELEILSKEVKKDNGQEILLLVEYSLKNTGEVEDTQETVLYVEGEKEKSSEIKLEPKEEHLGEFTVEVEEEEAAEIRIACEDDEETDTFTLEEILTEDEDEEDADTPSFSSLLLFVAIVFSIFLYNVKKS